MRNLLIRTKLRTGLQLTVSLLFSQVYQDYLAIFEGKVERFVVDQVRSPLDAT